MTEGDSVTLHNDITECKDCKIVWAFGASETSLIGYIKRNKQIFSTYDGPDGRFRDRLKLDHQTGPLTITNTRTEHAGLYKLLINGVKLLTRNFNVSVYGEQRLHLFCALNILVLLTIYTEHSLNALKFLFIF